MKFNTDQLLNENLIKLLLNNKTLLGHEAEVISALEKQVKQFLLDKVKEIKNKERIVKNDSLKDHVPALGSLSPAQIADLPNWVKENIANAILIGSSRKVIQLPSGKKYHLDNPLNELSGGEWTFFLNSVINTRYPTSGAEGYAHDIRKIHPSPKPPQLMKSIIEFFTKADEFVLDYFAGVGGTLLGASMSNRKAIGIELNANFIDAYKKASNYLDLKIQPTIVGDSRKILIDGKSIEKILDGEKASLILIDPPYGDMMSRAKTGESIKKNQDSSPTPYTKSTDDLGNMDLDKFHATFKEMVESSLKFLKPKGHLVVFIKDLQPKGKQLNMLHADLVYSLNEIPSLHYLGTKIWADQGVNLYPYGYPYSFVSNQIHQYILIFRSSAN